MLLKTNGMKDTIILNLIDKIDLSYVALPIYPDKQLALPIRLVLLLQERHSWKHLSGRDDLQLNRF